MIISCEGRLPCIIKLVATNRHSHKFTSVALFGGIICRVHHICIVSVFIAETAFLSWSSNNISVIWRVLKAKTPSEKYLFVLDILIVLAERNSACLAVVQDF